MEDPATASKYRVSTNVICKADSGIQIVTVRQVRLKLVADAKSHGETWRQPEVALEKRREFALPDFNFRIALIHVVLQWTSGNVVLETPKRERAVEIVTRLRLFTPNGEVDAGLQ